VLHKFEMKKGVTKKNPKNVTFPVRLQTIDLILSLVGGLTYPKRDLAIVDFEILIHADSVTNK